MHILMVDDENDLCQTVSTVLEVQGYTVSIATSGKEALDLFNYFKRNSRQPDLLITDISMPVMGGVELVRILRQQNIEIPVLAISGCATKDAVVNMLRLGALDLLEKPFSADELINSISFILKRVHSRKTVNSEDVMDIRKAMHDFNNWLNAIVGLVDIMQLSDGNLSIEERVENSNKFAGRIAAAANLAIQTLKRIKCPDGFPEKHDLHTIITETISLRSGQDTATVKFSLKFKADNSTVLCDETLMKNVFHNLIINAIYAMNSEGVITIETGTILIDAVKYILIVVSDNGCGMTENVRKRIFEPGFSTKDGNLRGIGLAAVRDTVLKYGGNIGVQSVPVAGSTFKILLPVHSSLVNNHVVEE